MQTIPTMPKGYLDEKIEKLRTFYNTATVRPRDGSVPEGMLRTDAWQLDEIKLNAQAIIDEINRWQTNPHLVAAGTSERGLS